MLLYVLFNYKIQDNQSLTGMDNIVSAEVGQVALEIQPVSKLGGAEAWWLWPRPAMGLLSLLGLYTKLQPNLKNTASFLEGAGQGGWWV